jgi:hypothetical protein
MWRTKVNCHVNKNGVNQKNKFCRSNLKKKNYRGIAKLAYFAWSKKPINPKKNYGVQKNKILS